MIIKKTTSCILLVLVCWLLLFSCDDNQSRGAKKIVVDPDRMDKATAASIHHALDYAIEHNGKVDDSIQLKFVGLVNGFYSTNENTGIWSHREKWIPLVDTVLNFIADGELYGLFPSDYHLEKFRYLKTKLDNDSLKRMDAELWARADLMLTDAFMHFVKDLRVGRLATDSTFLKKGTGKINNDFYFSSLKSFISGRHLTEMIGNIEPKHVGYQQLKKCLPKFLDSMDRKVYTYVYYPFKPNDEKDSLIFIKTIHTRLKESGFVEDTDALPDSLQLNAAIKKYQKKRGIKQDGKWSASLIRLMNANDVERFKRIAISLDRYKQLPFEMPDKYIWVNLPAYSLNVWEKDSIALTSKIICGKPATRTPLLYSVISDMVTYPTWTVPNSIISKQYLPKLKPNPNYLSRIGLRLVNNKGETVDAGTVNWSKYNKGIPFNVVQASGDGNALGIMKFNFSNPFSVYLHDTNQRYLFNKASRALSHGCVRVQKWEELAFYISRNDSMNLKPGDSLRYNTDSITGWLKAKIKKRIPVRNGIPLFITYICCEGKEGKIRFYDDIYDEDKLIREKYFSGK